MSNSMTTPTPIAIVRAFSGNADGVVLGGDDCGSGGGEASGFAVGAATGLAEPQSGHAERLTGS
jgi:hypothetical protein